MKINLLLASTILSAISTSLSAAEPEARGVEFYEQRIRPVLVEHCYQCHSEQARQAKKLRGGLRLDTAAGIKAGGETGALLDRTRPAESLLIKALRHEGEVRMPPKAKLGDQVVNDFATWIKLGAPIPPDRVTTAQPEAINWERARQFWAFQPPVKHPRPKVADVKAAGNDIDSFLQAELERHQLKPVRRAAKRELIRRATFDLLGLPPTPEEIDAFLKDESPEAFRRVVDRLLASPHYGERWGRYWLDVARYAEDKALAVAKPSPQAFRYRDWVVQAFNQDMPYDRFLLFQLAGDLLPEKSADPFTRLGGLGFQGLGAEYHKGNFAAQVMADELDDRIDTLSRGLLGLTVACARCHDHKYDPIPTRDYYSLAAAYQGSNLVDLSASPAEVSTRFQEWQQETRKQEASLSEWLQNQGQTLSKAALRDANRYLVLAYQLRVLRHHKVPHDENLLIAKEKLQPHLVRRLVSLLEQAKPIPGLEEWNAIVTKANQSLERNRPVGAKVQLPPEVQRAIESIQQKARKALDEMERGERVHQEKLTGGDAAARKRLQKAPVAAEAEKLLKRLLGEPRSPFVIEKNVIVDLLASGERTEYERRRQSLEARKKDPPPAPIMIHGIKGGGQAMRVHIRGRVENLGEQAPPGFLRILASAKKNPSKSFTRLELAQAIASAQNPLTARVMVNRVWQHHFGRGIVATPSNFGQLGDRPSHPELLDTLAVRFVESGWSVKWLHREIMLSAAYQRGSDRDSSNVIKDPENRYLWRVTPQRLDLEAWRDAVLAVSGRLDPTVGGTSVDLNTSTNVRRTIYAKVSRSVPNPTMTAFDFPDANVSNDRRSITTIPQQQLFVLNSTFMIEGAHAFAARLEKAEKTDRGRINVAFRLAFGRLPSEEELALGLEFLKQAAQSSGKEKLSPLEQYAQALLATNEFLWID